MVILSKKEYTELVTERNALKKRLDSVELAKDLMVAKIKEFETRINLLEITPKERVSQSDVIDQWMNGAEGK